VHDAAPVGDIVVLSMLLRPPNDSQKASLFCLCPYFLLCHATAHSATHIIAKSFLSVCLSDTWIVTKQKKLVPTFLHHMHPSFLTRRMVGGGDPST